MKWNFKFKYISVLFLICTIYLIGGMNVNASLLKSCTYKLDINANRPSSYANRYTYKDMEIMLGHSSFPNKLVISRNKQGAKWNFENYGKYGKNFSYEGDSCPTWLGVANDKPSPWPDININDYKYGNNPDRAVYKYQKDSGKFFKVSSQSKGEKAAYSLYCVYDAIGLKLSGVKSFAMVEDTNCKWRTDEVDEFKGWQVSVDRESFASKGCPEFVTFKKNGTNNNKIMYKIILHSNNSIPNNDCTSKDTNPNGDHNCSQITYSYNSSASDTSHKVAACRPDKKSEEVIFPTDNCGILGPQTVELIKQAINLIRYLVPVVLVIYGMLDFVSILFSGQEKVFREAWAKFVKRLIVGIVFLFIPSIISFILDLSGLLFDYNVDEVFCGIF